MSLEIVKTSVDVGVVVRDADKAVAFYGGLLGLPADAMPQMPMPGGVMHRFKAGDSIVKVIETDPKPEVEAAPGGIRGATGYRYWTLHITDLEGKLASLEAAGVKIVVPAKEIRAGVTIAIVADPDADLKPLLKA